jgi:hypothetical protein
MKGSQNKSIASTLNSQRLSLVTHQQKRSSVFKMITRSWPVSALVAVTAVVLSPNSVDAFANPRISSSLDTSKPSDVVDATENREINPFADFARPFVAVAAPLALSATLLFAPPPLNPTVQAIEPANAATPSTISPTATSIEIDLKGLPALTRKAIANRDQLQKYLIESAKSFQPILQLLSESDTVTITPPKDVKKAINSLLGGEAQFVVNKGDLVDIRVESVPGVIVVRIINPNLPRLPFLKDGSAAIKFVDQIVDVAPKELEKASEEVLAVEKFLTWGAPEKKQITFSDSQLGRFLSSKFEYNGKTINLGALGDLTNSEVIISGLGVGVAGVYGASYAYYMQLKEEAEREVEEKKAATAAKKAKAKEQAAAKPKPAVEVNVAKVPKPVMTVETIKNEPPQITDAIEEGYSAAAAASQTEPSTTTEDAPKKTRKRDAIKNLFKRGN